MSVFSIGMASRLLVAEWIHFTLYGDNMTHYKTKSLHFLGLMNSATKVPFKGTMGFRVPFRVL